MDYNELIKIVTENQGLVYIIYFLWSFFDGIIIINLFIQGEIIYFFAGYISSFKIIDPYLSFFILLFAGFLGDNISYFIGKKYFKGYFKKEKKIFNLKNLSRGEKFFKKYGNKAIVLSKVLGPLSSGISSFSGVFGVNFKNFIIYNTYGLFLLILSTFLIGYFTGVGAEYFGSSIIFNTILFIISLYFLLYIIKRLRQLKKHKKQIIYMLVKVLIVYFMSFLALLALYYFYLYPYFADFYDNNKVIPNLENWIKENDRKVYSDRIIKTNSNPINIVIVTQKNIDDIFEKIGWKANLSFSSGKIGFKKFINLLMQNSPPISDFYHYNFTQNHQYQDLEGGNIKREHIRFWEIGKLENGNKIYIGTVSRDKGISFMINNGIPIIGHGIDKNIDKSRDLIKDLIINNFKNTKVKILDFESFWKKNYFTDGDVVILEV